MLYFVTTFFSKVANATRSFSADGPTMVPASSRMIQSFFCDVVWMHRDVVDWHLSSEETHLSFSHRKLLITPAYTGAYAGSRRCTERLELRIGGEPFVGVSRAAARRQLEQAHRLVLRTLPQRQFAAVEIGFADLAPL